MEVVGAVEAEEEAAAEAVKKPVSHLLKNAFFIWSRARTHSYT